MDRAALAPILSDLRPLYPRYADLRPAMERSDKDLLVAKLLYLRDHGLVEFQHMDLMSGETLIRTARITPKGMDYLSDDGGLTAELGVVTIKLHEDTIRELLIAQVRSGSAAPSVKDKLADQIKSLPGEMLKTASLEAMKRGIAHIPDIGAWLHTLSGL